MLNKIELHHDFIMAHLKVSMRFSEIISISYEKPTDFLLIFGKKNQHNYVKLRFY